MELMAKGTPDSIDAIVTDPPYGLEFMGKDWDAPWKTGDGFRRSRNPSDAGRDSVFGRASKRGPQYRAGIGFQLWAEEWAAEALRVLKPGGHLLAFGGTRTYHRLVVALEDAGFEIRDCIAWMYGTGFPKSLDVSKAIDKTRGDNADWVVVGKWLKTQRESANHTRKSLAPLLSGHKNVESAAANVSNWENGLSFPTWDRWEELRGLLGFGSEMDSEVWRLNGRKGTPGEAWDQREVIGKSPNGFGPNRGASLTHDLAAHPDVTAPATDSAKEWQGWGTALKPAFEPIVVARKPLSEKTVAANVQRWGTGALNIDGTRIESEGGLQRPERRGKGVTGGWASYEQAPGQYGTPDGVGRWPANVTLDEAAAAMLDEQSGVSHSPETRPRNQAPRLEQKAKGAEKARTGDLVGYADTGGASRFFYIAKASRKERGEGNDHPTVKPVELMRWLVRLVTPPGGRVLDPFMGSGTTGLACVAEGFNFIGLELDQHYYEIASARIAAAQEEAA